MLAPVIGARRVRLLLSALVLPGLSGCVSLRQQRLAPGEEPVLIGAAARDNRTPMDPAFACFSAELSAVRHKPVVIAVGDVRDFTGKYSVSEGTARASTVPSIAIRRTASESTPRAVHRRRGLRVVLAGAAAVGVVILILY